MIMRILSLVCLVVPVCFVNVRAYIISVDNFRLVPEYDIGCDGEMRPEYSIMDLVSSNARLELMEQTILDAGMEQLLQQQQQPQEQSSSSSISSRLTLFAPTNAAFWNLDMERPGFLLLLLRDDWTFHLRDLVLHHVTYEGEFCHDYFYNEQRLYLQNGGEAEIKINENGVFLLPSPPDVGEQLEMVEFDQSASNGVIHEVHRVFLTKWFFRDAFLAANEEGYSMFSEMLTLAGLEDTFSDSNRIMTVFYPTNQAFAELPQETVQCWLKHPDILANVLFSHAIHGVFHSTTLQQHSDLGPFSYTDLHGIPLSVDSTDGTTTINGYSHLIHADILTYNGISHGIDKVLLFPGFACPVEAEPDVILPSTTATIIPTATTPPSSAIIEVEPITTVLQLLQERPNYLNIAYLVSIAGHGFESILSDSSAQLTFFAPIDSAFEHVPPEILACLMAANSTGSTDHSALLSSFLLYHLVNVRKIWSTEMADTYSDTMIVTTAEGAPLLIHHYGPPPTTTIENGIVVNAEGGILLEINNDGATVVENDIPAYNGVIHGISRVLFSPDFSC